MDWTTIIATALTAIASITAAWYVMRSQIHKEATAERMAQMKYDTERDKELAAEVAKREAARAEELARREAALWTQVERRFTDHQRQIDALGVENVELRVLVKSLQKQLDAEREVVSGLRQRIQELEDENKALKVRLGTGPFREEKK